MDKGISFVIPAYNEADNIPGVLKACLETSKSLSTAFEIIVVDDGSIDGTSEEVTSVQRNNPEVVLIKHEKNLGIAQTVRDGFAAARFSHIFYTDADAQFDPDDIKHLLPYADKYDFVVGYRAQRADPFNRKLNAWLYNLSLRVLLRIPIRDIDCAFKLIKTDSLRSLNASSNSAFYFAELINAAVRSGMTFYEIPVNHYPRQNGMQTGANPRVVLRAMMDMANHILKRRNSQVSADREA